MTNILNVILANVGSGSETLRFPERHVPAAEYRGAVTIDTSRCMTCGICDHVCVSGAIELRTMDDHGEWNYDPGRCTFCARCVDHCPVGALSQVSDRPEVYGSAGQLAVGVGVEYPACPECGGPSLPVSEAVLERAYEEVSAETRGRARLCDRCRRHAAQTALRETFGDVTRSEGQRS